MTVANDALKLPESKLAKEIIQVVKETSPVYLFNHCARAFLFARLLGRLDGRKCDEETLFYGCMMHDLGVTRQYRGKTRFEVDGADAAYKILTERGVSTHTAEIVWDAVALHATTVIATRKRPEIALVHEGTSVDVLGKRISEIPVDTLKHILEEYPRENFKQKIIDDFIDYLRQNPAGGAGYWMSELAETYLNVPHIGLEKALRAAPFEE